MISYNISNLPNRFTYDNTSRTFDVKGVTDNDVGNYDISITGFIYGINIDNTQTPY